MKHVARFALVTMLAAIAFAPKALAQAGTVAGTIVTEGSQRPLAGVQVGLAGVQGRGTLTDNTGRFRLTGLAGSSVILQIRFIGYRPVTDTVAVGNMNVRIALAERAVELNQIVVTGTAGAMQVREVGTSVASVKVADLVTQAAVPTVEGLLNARAPGVDVIATTGQVGAGAQIRVRGVGTFSLSSSPLVYVDGIRTDNQQTGIVARFNDIAPDEIERIEVLKGPAAATLYGTEAARGVINIITKHGDAGAPKYSFSVQTGPQWFQNAAGRFRTNYWRNPKNDSVYSINFVRSEAAHGTPLFRNGSMSNLAASASGGTAAYQYFVSGEWGDALGIVPVNARLQKNVRTNLSIVPSNTFEIATNVGYVTSRTNTGAEGGGAGPMWGEFAVPQRTILGCPTPAPRGCGWSRGSIVGPPEVYNATQNWQDVNRFTASGTLKWDPLPWMSHRMIIGTDYIMEDINSYLPYQTDSVIKFFLGSRFDGQRSETTQQTLYNTYDYSGTAHFELRPELVSKSTVGVQYYTNTQTALTASGQHFPSPGLSTITATGLKASPTSSYVANNTLGAFGQQEFALSNRLFVTGALRVDNNSAFGSKASFTTYPKLSASWVPSDDPRFRTHLPAFIDQLRLRGAFGASGQQPIVNSALQTLTPVAGPNGATTLTNGNIGNANLKPERVVGSEVGFEAGLFEDRAGIDLTLFNDISKDAILASTVAPSTAFGASTQYLNAGQINKHGLELQLKGVLLTRARYGWDMNFNIAATTSKIIRIGSGKDTLVNVTGGSTAVSTVGDVFHRVGYSPFDLFTYHVVSATYDPTTRKAINALCDNARGGTIPCFVPGTNTIQAPLVYFGHSIPTTTGSWSNTFRYGRFRAYVMVDFQAGFRKTDTHYEQVCQVFSGCLENVYPDRYDPAIVAAAQNGSGQIQDNYIRSASFTKLREVSLSYDAPASVLRAVAAKSGMLSVSARNLATRTQYTAIDPENSVVASGGNSNNFGTDQTVYPQLASVVFTLRLTY